MKYILPLIYCLFIGCSTEKAKENDRPGPYQALDKLNGLWYVSDGEGGMYEEWKTSSEDSMTGKSFKLLDQDTLTQENIVLTKNASGIWYIPTVNGQNNDQPVSFQLVASTDSSFVFENKQHDFPQRIVYRFITKDSLVARIEGLKNGSEEGRDFFYSRVNK